MSGPEHAPIRVNPPLTFVAGLLAGAGIQYFVPLPALSGTARHLAGIPLVVLSLLLGGSAFATLRRAQTSPSPYEPTTAIVATGPYRFTRNPIYLSFVLLVVGLAILLQITWAIVLLPLVIAVIQWGVILPEERYLSGRFGESYDAYRRKVRRWL